MARPVRFRNKWRIRWLDEHGVRHSDMFEMHEDAAFELRRHQAEVEERKRGLRRPEIADKTFDDLADYWIENRIPQKRSGAHDESIIRCHLRPHFGACRLRSFGIEEIDRFAVARQHLDPKTLSNHLTLLGSMLRVAVDLNWLDRLPRIRKPRVRIFSADFSYLRTDDEIARVLRAAREIGEDVFALYAAAIFTGMRAGELGALRWEDVNFTGRLICVQRSFEGPTKADDVRYVPIVDALLPTLKSWRLRSPRALVFPNHDGKMLLPASRIFQEVLHRVIEKAGLPKIQRKGKTRRYVVFHDLRHTFASHWVMNGGDLFKLQKILGHKTVQMTMRYAHLQPAAFATDYARMGSPPIVDVAPVLRIDKTELGAEELPVDSDTPLPSASNG